VTSRRLVLVAADPLVTPISLAFCLSGEADADPCRADTPRYAKGVLGAAADSIPPVRAPGFGSALDQRGGSVRAGQPLISPDQQGASARPSTSLAHRITRSTSSGSEQITLSVDTVEDPPTVLHHTEMRTSLRRLERTSLNPQSRLGEGVA
jgi:hypothetical protein